MAVLNRVKKAWNAFRWSEEISSSPEYTASVVTGPSYGARPDRQKLKYFNDRSIISAIYTRMSVDVAGIDIRHVLLDDQKRYIEDAESALNNCLTLEVNLDQTPRPFRQDIALTLFDKGVAAIVPVDTVENPTNNLKFDIYSMRVGEVIAWYPKHVKLSVYNEERGVRQEVLLEKRFVAIVDNPFYSVMNEQNSTLQRLIRKLNLLDSIDEATGSGKLDLIIQLPYTIKTEARRVQAEKRREEIEFQLQGSKYGIAYTDGTEKITQLNRPAENNLLQQIEVLTKTLYSQLSLTEEVMNGTADEKTMLNYYNRTIEPIVENIVEAMQRSFIGEMGTKQKERIKYFRDPFKLVPLGQIADLADKLTRNEIVSSNEIRAIIGLAPAKDPKADELRNSNMPQPKSEGVG